MRKGVAAFLVGAALVASGWYSGRHYAQHQFKMAVLDLAKTPTGDKINTFQKCLTEGWARALELQTNVPPLRWKLVPNK